MNFRAVGVIAGSYIARDKPVQIGQFVLRPASAQEIHDVVKWRISPSMSGVGGDGVSFKPTDVSLDSRALVEFEIDAPDHYKAAEVAEAQLGVLLPVLHSLTGERYTILLSRLDHLQEGSRSGPWGPAASFRFVTNAQFSDDALELAERRLRAARENKSLQRAGRYLQNAVNLLDIQDGQTPDRSRIVAAAGLFNLFQCIESVAQSVSTGMGPPAEKVTANQATVVSQLRASLGKDQPLEKQVARIQEAADELKRIEERFLDLRIERMGEVLELSDELIAKAKSLHKFRNDQLGHPRTDPPSQEAMTAWIGQDNVALGVATSILARVIDYTGGHLGS